MMVMAVVLVAADRVSPPRPFNYIAGPYARLLAQFVDLGPARSERVQLTVELRGPTRPVALMSWAGDHGLSVQWRDGDPWASVAGAPRRVAGALDVAVHDYRGKDGTVFYASPQQPAVPATSPVRSWNSVAFSATRPITRAFHRHRPSMCPMAA